MNTGRYFIKVELEEHIKGDYITYTATLYERITGTSVIEKPVFTSAHCATPIAAVKECSDVYWNEYKNK